MLSPSGLSISSGIRVLATLVTKGKTEKIIVRVKPKTKRRFRVLAAAMGFRNYEQLLEWLLDKAESEWIQERVY
jgi:hypothetical protein